jgi:hypothetical protein
LINEMVGIPSHAELRLAAYRAPGEPDGKTLLLQTRGVPVVSIAERMRPPNLGIVMLGHETDDLDGLLARLAGLGAERATEPGEIRFGAGPRTRCALVRAPRGVLIELFETA